MDLLVPDWNQRKPTPDNVREMVQRIQLTPVRLPAHPFDKFLDRVRDSHVNGGAHLAAFNVGPDDVFDWFASRKRLWEERILDLLVLHPVIAEAIPELRIP